MICKYHSLGSFVPLLVSFDRYAKVFNFDEVEFIWFFFFIAFGVIANKSLLKSMS